MVDDLLQALSPPVGRAGLIPGFVVWFTGLPSAGKTTLARAVQDALAADGIPTQLLDSDELRDLLTPAPTYTAAERDQFYAQLAALAALLAANGVNVLIAATASRRAYRDDARRRLTRFAEVFVDTPLDVCRARDPKGLYARAQRGAIENLPGVQEPYEAPVAAEFTVTTAGEPRGRAAARLAAAIRAHFQSDPGSNGHSIDAP